MVFLGSSKSAFCFLKTSIEWRQLYYEDFKGLPPIQTAIRLLPMTVTGVACNVLIALLIGRVDLVVIIGT